MNFNFFIKNIHLIISTAIVLPISIVYGFFPEMVFSVSENTIDEQNILKALMGIYIGFSILWIVGIYKPELWKTATISNFIFMFGLAFGRNLSIIFDGKPSLILILGLFGELILGIYGLYMFKNHKATN